MTSATLKPRIGAGRPPISPEDRLSELVQFRLTPGELASLTAKAEERGASLTDLIRKELSHLI
jgi:hypothetical protein